MLNCPYLNNCVWDQNNYTLFNLFCLTRRNGLLSKVMKDCGLFTPPRQIPRLKAGDSFFLSFVILGAEYDPFHKRSDATLLEYSDGSYQQYSLG